MGVCPSIDQLRGDPNAVPRALDATFHHMGNTEFFGHLAQFARYPALVLLNAGAADHPEVGDLGEVVQNFVLHAISEKGVLSIVAQIFKWKDGDTLIGDAGKRRSKCFPGAAGDRQWAMKKDKKTESQRESR